MAAIRLSHVLAAVLVLGVAAGCTTTPKGDDDAGVDTGPAVTQEPGTSTNGIDVADSQANVEGTGAGDAAAYLNAGEDTYYFAFDSDTLEAGAHDSLEANIAYLKANSGAKVRLAGNCDDRGSREYNYSLGQRRAHSVSEYLRSRGVSSSQIETVSYGKDRPVCNDDDNACWSKNRRVDLTYLSEKP